MSVVEGYSVDPVLNECVVEISKEKMKISAVITCVNYADTLAHTLMMNRGLFDEVLILTSPEDKTTMKVCDYWRVKYHATDAFQSRWGNFCKGSAINEGLEHISLDDWVVHLDADIALAPNTREVLERANLDKTHIYGTDRWECKSYQDWQEFIDSPCPNVAGNGFMIDVSHSPFQLGTRVSFDSHGGYIPIGFFQLWNPKASGHSKYEEGHSDAGREDSVFAARWPRSKRSLIPEIAAYHLESGHYPMAVNWKGRVSKPFSMKAHSGNTVHDTTGRRHSHS